MDRKVLVRALLRCLGRALYARVAVEKMGQTEGRAGYWAVYLWDGTVRGMGPVRFARRPKPKDGKRAKRKDDRVFAAWVRPLEGGPWTFWPGLGADSLRPVDPDQILLRTGNHPMSQGQPPTTPPLDDAASGVLELPGVVLS